MSGSSRASMTCTPEWRVLRRCGPPPAGCVRTYMLTVTNKRLYSVVDVRSIVHVMVHITIHTRGSIEHVYIHSSILVELCISLVRICSLSVVTRIQKSSS